MRSFSRNRMDRSIVEYLDCGASDPVAQVAMEPVAGREVDFSTEPSREILAPIHERHETESAVVDVREKDDVRPFGRFVSRKRSVELERGHSLRWISSAWARRIASTSGWVMPLYATKPPAALEWVP